MNITHLITLSETPGVVPFAGAESHLLTLMRGQARAGHSVEFAPLVLRDGPMLRDQYAELARDGIAVHPIPVERPYDWKLNLQLMLRLIPFFRKRRRHIIHTHLDNADYVGRISAWLAGCRRIISTNHNNEPHYAERYWKLKLRLIDPFNGHYIAISDLIRRFLIDTVGLPEKKITTVYYGTQALDTQPKEALRRKLGLPLDKFIVGFVGRFEPQKNLPVLLQALDGLDSVQGALIGMGSLDGEIREWAAGHAGLHLLGYQPQAADLIPAFDVFCLPSKWEGLGLVLLEAMLRGVPIIGSTAGAIPEVLGNGEFGLLFDPDWPSQLREKILFARQNPAVIADLAAKARRHAGREFTVEGMVRKTLALYEQLG